MEELRLAGEVLLANLEDAGVVQASDLLVQATVDVFLYVFLPRAPEQASEKIRTARRIFRRLLGLPYRSASCC